MFIQTKKVTGGEPVCTWGGILLRKSLHQGPLFQEVRPLNFRGNSLRWGGKGSKPSSYFRTERYVKRGGHCFSQGREKISYPRKRGAVTKKSAAAHATEGGE